MSGKGTREALLALRTILERRMSVNRKTYVVFVDIQKAFDKVNWKQLFKAMKNIGLDWRDRRLILLLYKNKSTEINVNGKVRTASIRRGVRQGCALSPYLFNIFIEEVISKFKQKTKGIKVNGQEIHCIRFADDIALTADSEKELSKMMRVLSSMLQEANLKLNTSKTKVLVVNKSNENIQMNIKINGETIQQCSQFCYLGSIVTDDNRCTTEIKRRIALAKQAFSNKRQLLTSRHISIETRKSFIKTFVWSVLLYGCETWALRKQDIQRLEAAEMWIWRRMLKISWTEKKSNEWVLKEIHETRKLITNIEKRKAKFVGHTLRHNEFLTTILEGKVLGKKGRGRPRKAHLDSMIHGLQFKQYADLKRSASERQMWLQRQGLAFR